MPIQKSKILLIDDDRDLRETLADGIEAAGYEVIQADGLQDVMKKLPSMKVAIVIVDLVLVGTPGAALLGYIKTHPQFKSTKVIMMSGFDHGETTARLWGADLFLKKPVTITRLVEALNNFSAPADGVAHGAVK